MKGIFITIKEALMTLSLANALNWFPDVHQALSREFSQIFSYLSLTSGRNLYRVNISEAAMRVGGRGAPHRAAFFLLMSTKGLGSCAARTNWGFIQLNCG
jgi:hypothetical protein